MGRNQYIMKIVSNLDCPSDQHAARFQASLQSEASLWLTTIPSKDIDTSLDDNTFRISVQLHL